MIRELGLSGSDGRACCLVRRDRFSTFNQKSWHELPATSSTKPTATPVTAWQTLIPRKLHSNPSSLHAHVYFSSTHRFPIRRPDIKSLCSNTINTWAIASQDRFLFAPTRHQKKEEKIVLLSSAVSVGDETSIDQSINQCYSDRDRLKTWRTRTRRRIRESRKKFENF